ncbi:MAG: hypothetical protein WCP59_12385 [Actinomycetota bacterium]|jgi:hypothetical protein
MTEWNPDDPDASSVHYDLSAWNFDQQAALAAAMADAEIPHGWMGTELVVPDDFEDMADDLIAEVEERLGITYDESIEYGEPIEYGEVVVVLRGDEPTTEYDLDEWPADDRTLAGRALTDALLAHRWDGTVLLVRTADEAVVDALLDTVERGEFVDLEASAPAGVDPDLDAEILTTFFLAGERLRRNPLDADGLEQLVAASEVADPDRPPFGVQPRLWQQTCALADRVVDALVGDTGDTGDTAIDDIVGEPGIIDFDAAAEAAAELHDLLRPYI